MFATIIIFIVVAMISGMLEGAGAKPDPYAKKRAKEAARRRAQHLSTSFSRKR